MTPVAAPQTWATPGGRSCPARARITQVSKLQVSGEPMTAQRSRAVGDSGTLGSARWRRSSSAREVEGGEACLAGGLCAARAPVEAPCDHEVEDEEELLFEGEHDALAQPAKAQHLAPLYLGDRRVDAAQERRAHDPNALEGLALAALLQALDVEADVRKLGHASQCRTQRRPTLIG